MVETMSKTINDAAMPLTEEQREQIRARFLNEVEKLDLEPESRAKMITRKFAGTDGKTFGLDEDFIENLQNLVDTTCDDGTYAKHCALWAQVDRFRAYFDGTAEEDKALFLMVDKLREFANESAYGVLVGRADRQYANQLEDLEGAIIHLGITVPNDWWAWAEGRKLSEAETAMWAHELMQQLLRVEERLAVIEFSGFLPRGRGDSHNKDSLSGEVFFGELGKERISEGEMPDNEAQGMRSLFGLRIADLVMEALSKAKITEGVMDILVGHSLNKYQSAMSMDGLYRFWKRIQKLAPVEESVFDENGRLSDKYVVCRDCGENCGMTD